MFASLQNKRKLEEATSAKDDVAPVYLLEEIWDLLRSSPPDVVASMVTYLNGRLSNKSPIVKQKACRLIKYICAKGSSEFKRNISKHAASVRELTSYKGEPDPFKGDVPNQRVRDAAKEALDAMFAATDPSYAASSATPSLTNRIQGFGSSADPTGGPGTSSITSSSSFGGGSASGGGGAGARMMGFGNPRFETPGANRGTSGSSSVVSPKAILGTMVDFANQARAALPQTRGKSFLGGDEGGYSSGDDGTSGGGSGYSQPRLDKRSGPYGPPGGGTGSAASSVRDESGAEELHLVENICTPGGLRAQPDREDLRLFVESAASLSGPRIAELLTQKIEDSSWQVVLRALCALEAVIQQGSSASCGEIAIHFQTNPAPVRRAAASPQASVKQRGNRVLQLLGADAAAAAPSKRSVAPGAAQPAGGPDLLGDLLGGEPEPAPASQAPAGTGDLLGDLLAPAPQDAASSLMGLDGPTPLANPSPAAPTSDIFGGLSVGAAPVPQPAAAPAAPSGSLFGGLDLGPSGVANGAVANGGAAAGDLFGGLDMGNGRAGAAGTAGASTGGASSGALDADLFGGLSVPGPSQAPPLGVNGLADMLGGLSTGGLQQPQVGISGLHPYGTQAAQYPTGGFTPYGPPAPVQYGNLGQNPGLLPQGAYTAGQPEFPQMQLGGVPHAGQYMAYGGPGTKLPYGGLQMPGLGGPGGHLEAMLGGATGPTPLYSKPGVMASSMFDSVPDATAASRGPDVGLTTESTFDFVGDHMSTLRTQK